MKRFGLIATSRTKAFVFKFISVPAKWVRGCPSDPSAMFINILSSNPQPPSKNDIEMKEEAMQKKRLKEVKIATRRHKIPLPHNAT